MSFADRNSRHKEAYAIFKHQIEGLGIKCLWFGYENAGEEALNILRNVTHNTALFMRHFPDGLVVFIREGPTFFDIKSEREGYPNYAVEIDSLWAALELCKINFPVFFVCVDLQSGTISFIHAKNTPCEKIYLPRRFWGRHGELCQKFMGAKIERKENTRGSNTPYILIPKTSEYLIPLSEFIKEPFFKPLCMFKLIPSYSYNDGTVQMGFEVTV